MGVREGGGRRGLLAAGIASAAADSWPSAMGLVERRTLEGLV